MVFKALDLGPEPLLHGSLLRAEDLVLLVEVQELFLQQQALVQAFGTLQHAPQARLESSSRLTGTHLHRNALSVSVGRTPRRSRHLTNRLRARRPVHSQERQL